MIGEREFDFLRKARIQGRVIWALTMREVITRFGREGLGVFWLLAEPAMFIVGVMIIFSHIEKKTAFPIAEYLSISYPTLLFWRNGTGRVIKALEVNRALLHHQPIRPIDIIYSRILLEFSGSAGAFFILYMILIQLNICQWPDDIFAMVGGYMLIIWFSFCFVLIMAALSELSESIERVSHIILYLMLPFSGVFIPLATLPSEYREMLLWFPLIDAVEYFRHGYYGMRMATYYNIPYTIFAILGLMLFAYGLTRLSIRKISLH
ncbi:ABC transporter permease [Paraburkholderia sp. Ac-20336]|uniref:ABC transporter permease n=1 Tax=Burkholderiaceae TaxID=119060 RepID=UPI00141EDF88|nr:MULTISPECIES: ABC transporter permease [Burkholderiaceae]MBN3804603.1 ABC transporter permease [Paraburkholderia sp. Ac-20336]MBN3849913.1 ABC transporter permease [Paraburkholderia sp. Ac-20342]NIF56127.1 sugar ABC transporter permease [Burkholderia sp. Ax-1724]